MDEQDGQLNFAENEDGRERWNKSKESQAHCELQEKYHEQTSLNLHLRSAKIVIAISNTFSPDT